MGSSTLAYHEAIEAEEAKEREIRSRTTYQVVLTHEEQDRLAAMLNRMYLPAGFSQDKSYQSMVKKLSNPKVIKGS